jgi:hypothetical protein
MRGKKSYLALYILGQDEDLLSPRKYNPIKKKKKKKLSNKHTLRSYCEGNKMMSLDHLKKNIIF